MALIDCPECANQVSTLATACPKCGYPLSEIGKRERDAHNSAEALVYRPVHDSVAHPDQTDGADSDTVAEPIADRTTRGSKTAVCVARRAGALVAVLAGISVLYFMVKERSLTRVHHMAIAGIGGGLIALGKILWAKQPDEVAADVVKQDINAAHSHRPFRFSLYVLTGLIVLGGIGGIAYYTIDQLTLSTSERLTRRMLEANGAFAALAEREPRFKQEVQDRLSKSGKLEIDFATAYRIGQEVAGPYLIRYSQRTSDECLLNYYRELVKISRHLNLRDPAAALAFLMGSDKQPAQFLFAGLDEAEFDRITERMIRASGKNRVKYDKERAERLLGNLLEEAIAREGDEFAEVISRVHLGAPLGKDVSYAASSMIKLMQSVLSLDEPESALVMRHLFSE